MSFFFDTWQTINTESIGTNEYWYIALQNLFFHRAMLPFIKKYAHGNVLDCGAGKLAWKTDILETATSYFALDVTPEHPDLDLVCDSTKPYPLPDETYDVIFSCSVMEHIPHPSMYLSECYRLLKPHGCLILSIPFLFYLHGVPYDYFRFTPYGLQSLAEEAKFTIEDQVFHGGPVFQLLNPLSMACACLLQKCGLKKALRYPASFFTFLADGIDSRWDKNGRFASSLIAILRK